MSLDNHQLTPRAPKRHPLSISTVPFSPPTPIAHLPASVMPKISVTTPRAGTCDTRPRLTPIMTRLTPLVPVPELQIDIHQTSFQPISPLDLNPYISPSNPISRTALPSFSPRAYSALFDATSRSSVVNGTCAQSLSPSQAARCGRAGVPGIGSPRTGVRSPLTGLQNRRGVAGGMESAMRLRASGTPPAILHLTQSPLPPSSEYDLATSPLLNLSEASSGEAYSMATYPLDLPIRLAPSPTLREYNTSSRSSMSRRYSLLKHLLPSQTTAFIRKHMSLLLYVVLGMVISLTLLTGDPNIQGGAGAVVDLATPMMPAMAGNGMSGLHGAGRAHHRGVAEKKSAMGVWADYVDARRNSGRGGVGDWLGVHAGQSVPGKGGPTALSKPKRKGLKSWQLGARR